ncbi:transcriptional regulator, TetR family [Aquipluma nitroreducens]|uniref:Transcriptional regulator, TetR family n=1 Tax=Aquipluma nitroreducens TaxID=2010828 RepID=A0A5K7SC56_9BACT|nr:TetR/AcrR family transcriptional regulator [Aquipluma nitroreducens]BBE19047.1 transcriptional regulator, TetR family [Aquipluma nitroreducens]
MSPRTSTQFETIRQEKRKVILEAALELFAENGFHATSMSTIAKKGGISKGLAYNYFESKNDILEEIVDEGFHQVHDLLDPDKDGVLSEEEFISFLEKTFAMVKNNHRYWKLYFALMIQPVVSENLSEKYAKAGEPLFRMMHEFIASKGSSDPEGDLMIISAMLEGTFLYAIVAPDIFPIDRMKEKVIDGIFRIIQSGNKNKAV